MLAASPSLAQNSNDILIDVITPTLSANAGSATYAKQLVEAANIMVDSINAAGGVLGRSIRVNFLDDRGLEKEATNVAYDVIADKPALVIGNGATPTTMNTEIVLRDYPFPYMALANGNKITEKPSEQNHRILPRSKDYAAVAAPLLLEKADGISGPIVIVHDGSEYGGGFADALMNQVPSLHGRIEKQSVGPTDKDFRGLIANMQSRKVGIVVLATSDAGHNGLIVRQASERSYHPSYLSFSNATFPDFSSAADTGRTEVDIIGVRGCDREALRKDPDLWKLSTAFEQRGAELTDGALGMIAAFQVGTQAILRAGTTEPHAVNAAIRSGTFETAMGTFKFDQFGDKRVPLVLCRWTEAGNRMVQIGGLRYPQPALLDKATPNATAVSTISQPQP